MSEGSCIVAQQHGGQTVDLPEAKQRTGHERIEEQFVKPHVSFLTSNPRHQLNRLLRCKGIHDCSKGLKWKGKLSSPRSKGFRKDEKDTE